MFTAETMKASRFAADATYEGFMRWFVSQPSSDEAT